MPIPNDGWHKLELPHTSEEVEVYAEFELDDSHMRPLNRPKLIVHICDVRTSIMDGLPQTVIEHLEQSLREAWGRGDFEE